MGRVSFRIALAFIGLAACLMPLAPQAGWAQIEEIVVTARKREESLQDVPVQIQAVTATEIEAKGLSDLEGILKQTTSVIFDTGFVPQDIRVVIRGLSPTRGRQNLAVLQDGVDISSEAIATAGGTLLINPRLYDLERVEVVKGPQNALFGRSAFAGAVNYITRRPGDEFAASLGLDVGSNGQREIRARLSGPLSDNFAAGFAVTSWEHDGFYRNSISGRKIGDQDGNGAALSALWKYSERGNAYFRAEYSDDHFGPAPETMVRPPATANLAMPTSAISTTVIVNGLPRTILSPAVTAIRSVVGALPSASSLVPTVALNPRTNADYHGTDREITRLALNIDHDFGPVKFESMSHYAQADVFQFTDSTRAGDIRVLGSIQETHFTSDTSLLTQEFRLSSNSESKLRWVGGLLYWQEEVDFIEGTVACNNYPAGFPCATLVALVDNGIPRNPRLWLRDTEHYSAYGLVDYRFNDQWSLAAEARWSTETLTIGGPDAAGATNNPALVPGVNLPANFVAPPGWRGTNPNVTTFGGFGNANPFLLPSNTRTGIEGDAWFSPKVTLQWRPGDNRMVYLSYATGYKPEGITSVTGGQRPFVPNSIGGLPALDRFKAERLKVYELGAKTAWADNRFVLNGALFLQDFTDKQSSTQICCFNNALSIAPVNAGSAEVKGIEIEAQWAPNANFSASLAATILDTKYQDFIIASGGAAVIAEVGNCVPTVVPLTTSQSAVCNVNYAGRELEDAPKLAVTGDIEVRRPVSGDKQAFVGLDFQYQSERYESVSNRSYISTYFESNLRVGIKGEKWDVTAYVNNLFDDDTIRAPVLFPDFRTFRFVFAPAPTTVVLENGIVVRLPPPRHGGIRFTYRF